MKTNKNTCGCVSCSACNGRGVKIAAEVTVCETCSGKGGFAKCFEHANSAGWLDAQDRKRYESYQRRLV